jgi:hypothetical protein
VVSFSVKWDEEEEEEEEKEEEEEEEEREEEEGEEEYGKVLSSLSTNKTSSCSYRYLS